MQRNIFQIESHQKMKKGWVWRFMLVIQAIRETEG
jgi:hypothetical protein